MTSTILFLPVKLNPNLIINSKFTYHYHQMFLESNVAEFQCAAAMIEEMSDGCSSLFTEKDLTDSSHLGVNQNVISMDDLTPCNLNSSSTRLATILGSNSVICIESDGLESATSRDGMKDFHP